MKPFFLPAGWEIKLFGQCIKKVKYTEKQPTKSFLPEGKFPIVSQEKELISGYSNNQNAVFSVKNPVVIFGDHTKVVKYIDFDFVIGADGVKILQPIEDINAKYFYYYLSHLHLRDLGYARHYKLLKECIVIYPPLPEQKRIVEKLDKIFAAIDKAKSQTEKNFQNAKDIFSSYFNNIFNHPAHNGEEKTLGDILQLEYGKALKNSDRDSNGKYPVYGANGIKTYTNRYLYDKYTIIIGRKGSAGEINLTTEKFWPLDVTYYVIFDRQKYNLYFLYFLLSYLNLPTLAKGVKPGINRAEVYSLPVSIPPIAEQKRIVEKLDILQSKTKELEKIYTQKLADLEGLKQSVLQQAFSGKL